MKKLTILIDMDDTIEDLVVAWVDYLNRTYGSSVRYEEIVDWDITKFFPMLSAEQIYSPLSTDRLWKKVLPKPNAVGHMKQLKSEGHQLFIVTSCSLNSVVPKMRNVFLKHLDEIFSWDDVIITSRKQLIKGDILIDDGVHNHGGQPLGILMHAHHNAKYDAESSGLVRARSWEEVYEIICDYADEGGESWEN